LQAAAAAPPVKKNRKTARGLGISAEPQSLKSLQVKRLVLTNPQYEYYGKALKFHSVGYYLNTVKIL
jgi:hypothetical protein